MQQELKYEAYRMESVRKSVETTCFDRCIAPPAHAAAVLAKALPTHIPVVQATPTDAQRRTRFDLSDEEALCVDRCAWKYMLTAKIVLQTLAKAKFTKDPQQQHGGMR